MNDSDLATASLVFNFEPLKDSDQLPFPLYLEFSFRLPIAITLTAVFLQGLCYRSVIFQYLAAEDSKKPINQLIILDQLNGILLSAGLLMRIIALLYPYPLSSVLGHDFCTWTSLPGAIYTSGKTCWSCSIALIRVIYIKAQARKFFFHHERPDHKHLILLNLLIVASS